MTKRTRTIRYLSVIFHNRLWNPHKTHPENFVTNHEKFFAKNRCFSFRFIREFWKTPVFAVSTPFSLLFSYCFFFFLFRGWRDGMHRRHHAKHLWMRGWMRWMWWAWWRRSLFHAAILVKWMADGRRMRNRPFLSKTQKPLNSTEFGGFRSF